METNGRLLLDPGELQRRRPAPPDERRVFPRELRRRGVVHALPQPPMAPRLSHRPRRHHLCMAVSLFPPRRPHRAVGVCGGRPPRAGGSFHLHGGFAPPHACHHLPGRAGSGGRRGGGACLV